MANLMRLPLELINHILMHDDIDIKDILNVGLTCKRLHAAIDNDYLWRRKLFQRWPSLKRVPVEWLNDDIGTLEPVIEGMKYEKQLSHCLRVLALDKNLCYGDDTTFDFLFFMKESTDFLRYYYFHDKLNKILEEYPLEIYMGNEKQDIYLENKYFGKEFMVYMNKCFVKQKWQKFINLPAERQTLEQVATLVAQWCQPFKHVFHSDIAASLDSIVQQTLKILKDIHPAYSIFATSTEQLSHWKNNNISDNHWNKTEARQIIDVIGRVIFRELRYDANSKEGFEEYSDETIFFIDQVFKNKRGTDFSFLIIIQSVARRLGVRCDLISISPDVFLRWRESYKTDYKYQEDCCYIDVCSDGFIIINKDHPDYRMYDMIAADLPWQYLQTPTKVMLRLTQCLENKFSRITRKYHYQFDILICSMDDLERMVKRSLDLENLDASTVSMYGDFKKRNEIIRKIAEIELTYMKHIQNIYKRKNMQDTKDAKMDQ